MLQRFFNMRIQFLVLFTAIFILSCKPEQPVNTKYGCTNPFAINYMEDAEISEPICLQPAYKKRIPVILFTSVNEEKTGLWLNQLLEEVEADFGDKIVRLNIYTDIKDPFYKASLNFLYPQFEGMETPSLFIGQELLFKGELTNLENLRTEISTAINSQLLNEPLISTDSRLVIKGNTNDIYFGCRYFKNVVGDFSVSVFLLEDKIKHIQAGSNNPLYEHNFVVREQITDVFGDAMGNGAIDSGFAYHSSYSVPFNGAYKKENLYLLTLVWRKIALNTYELINICAAK